MEERVNQHIEDCESFCVETVLSTDKYKPLVERAKQLGMRFTLIYAATCSPDVNVSRVKARAALGGHDVPEDRVRARYSRSLANLGWFTDQADALVVVDNSKKDPVYLIECEGSNCRFAPGNMPEWLVNALGPERLERMRNSPGTNPSIPWR